jgi:hypothetical protein
MTMTTTDTIDRTYQVQFTGDYFSLTTTVVLTLTEDEDNGDEPLARAEQEAIDLMNEYYGWDMSRVSNDIKVEEVNYL